MTDLVHTCQCDREMLADNFIVPLKANNFDGPDKDGWTMYLPGDCHVNISYCPFCGGSLDKRPDPWPLQ